MDTSAARELLEHAEWADARVWRSVMETPGAHGSDEVRQRLHHTHLVQHLYLQIWRGEPMRIDPLDGFGGMEAVRAWATEFHRGALDFARTLGDGALAREVAFPWGADLAAHFGAPGPVTLAQSIVQVAMHTAHHRGQLCADLRRLGAEPPAVDFVIWLWAGRPAAEWEPSPEAEPPTA